VEAGLKPGTSGQLSKSEDDGFYAGILNDHKGEQQIVFKYRVKTGLSPSQENVRTGLGSDHR